MRHLFHFERRRQPLASAETFSNRLARNGLWALAVVIVSIAVGMAGYMGFEGMGLVDAFANAAMILSGMGPLTALKTDAGKIFAGIYAIVSGLLLFGLAGLILAPVYHRILHRFHVEEADEKTAPPLKRKKTTQ
jgi:predicted PurR-regulated permease PerM